MNWDKYIIVKASEVQVGDRSKRQASVGNLTKPVQYLEVVKMAKGAHPKNASLEGVIITFRDMKTGAKKTEFQRSGFEMAVYRNA